MLITRKSMLTRITRTLDLPITEDQMDKYERGVHVQHAFPNLSAGQREFIMTGITDEEWDATFRDDENEGGEE